MNTPPSTPAAPTAATLDPSRVRAITLDLDDTLWPIWPTIERAEAALAAWLLERAPATAAKWGDPVALREVRNQMHTLRPELANDMSALRRESIRLVLQREGDDPSLAEAAFEVFFAERQRVELFEDALPALEWLASRYPVVALSNGNADVHRIGLGQHFHASLSAHVFGVGKPDVRIFHAAAEAAGVPSEAVLHVGDDAHLDAVGALGAGMQVAWLNRGGHPWDHAPLQPHTTVPDLMALCRQLG
ncbi:HAD family hydrolase [Hydrogenophaga sp.]|uniref:HAD family hydrolase n=1 Tax=Hydrogenophaga sp. TaxID=1904254 RepID=UPI003F6F1C7B